MFACRDSSRHRAVRGPVPLGPLSCPAVILLPFAAGPVAWVLPGRPDAARAAGWIGGFLPALGAGA